jgi:hypothetical protein
MDDLVATFKQRQTMDTCGITTTLGIDSSGQVVQITASSTAACTLLISGVKLSGSTVTMETYGPETTAYVNMTAGVSQSFALSTAISL